MIFLCRVWVERYIGTRCIAEESNEKKQIAERTGDEIGGEVCKE